MVIPVNPAFLSWAAFSGVREKPEVKMRKSEPGRELCNIARISLKRSSGSPPLRMNWATPYS